MPTPTYTHIPMHARASLTPGYGWQEMALDPPARDPVTTKPKPVKPMPRMRIDFSSIMETLNRVGEAMIGPVRQAQLTAPYAAIQSSLEGARATMRAFEAMSENARRVAKNMAQLTAPYAVQSSLKSPFIK